MRKIEPEFITGMGYIGASLGVLYHMGGAGEQTVVTGNPALLEGVKGNRFTSLTLHGKTSQKNTTGAQLFPPPSLGSVEKNGITLDYMEDGKINIRGTAEITTDFYVSRLQLFAATYTLSVGANIDKRVLRVALCDDTGIPYLDIREDSLYTTGTIESAIDVSLLIRVYAGKSIDLTVQPMLNIGSAALPYEPYTGGKPSPSPEYPQEIESVGDAGEISVEVCGKNLIAGRKFYGNYSNGIAYIIKLDGDVVFPYKPSYATYGICYAINALAGKKYTFSGYNLNDNASLRIAEYANLNDALDFANVIGYKFGGRADTFVTYTAKENGVIICSISGIWSSNNDLIHICTESELLQIELGSTATSYEPYKPAQTLIVPTPNGLPGIPVSSGGNYTDEKGQQWVADEIDLAKGERVQRIGKTVVDGEKVKFVASSNSVYWNLPFKTSPGIISGSPCTSRYFADGKFWANNSYDFVWTTPGKMKPYFDTSEELNAFCVQKNSEGNPLTIYYCIETPIRTPLSPETIAAYKALRTYSPTTTVINDAGAGMSVGYKRK